MIKLGKFFFFQKFKKFVKFTLEMNIIDPPPKSQIFLQKMGKLFSPKTLIKKKSLLQNKKIRWSAAARWTTTCARGDVVRSFATSSFQLAVSRERRTARCICRGIFFVIWGHHAGASSVVSPLVFLIHFYYYFLVWTATREKQLVSQGGWAAVVCGSFVDFFGF